jgi:hypothetical protein
MLISSPSATGTAPSQAGYEIAERQEEEVSPPKRETIVGARKRSRMRHDALLVIQRVGILSAGKVLGAMYALLGLVVGGITTLLTLIGVGAANQAGRGGGEVFALLFGFGAIICAPIFYGLIGFIGGILGALIYNLVASLVGGMEIEVESIS